MFGNKFLLLIGHKKNDIKNRLINLLHKISIMEKSIKGTRTEQNLLKSFAGESQARSRYTFFASVAKKEGYEQIAGVFMETAEQEKEHAKRFFKFLEGGMVENEEWAELYPEFAKIAEEEGFPAIAVAFKMIAKVEAEHENRYRKLLNNVETGTVFEKAEAILWQCRNCGFVFEGKKAPVNCPACAHPQAYFEPMKQNY